MSEARKVTPVTVIPVVDTLSVSWNNVYGNKKSFWAAFAINMLIMFGLGILTGITKDTGAVNYVISVISQVIGFLLQIGLLYMGIQCSRGLPISYEMMFRTFEYNITLKLIGIYFLQMIILLAPSFLIVVSVFLYATGGFAAFAGAILFVLSLVAICILMVRLAIGMGFVVDKGLNPWDAIVMSYQATAGNFWSIVGIGFAQAVILCISILPLFIGLIWAMPFTFICYGVMYNRLLVNVEIK
jgi:hypothetical protein